MKEFIANFYELWGGAYLGAFSDQMYNNDLYMPITLYSVIMAFVLPFVYYYFIDRPITAKFSIWLIMSFLGGVIAFIIAYVSSNFGLIDVFQSAGVDVPSQFSTDMIIFALINTAYSMLALFLFSILLKRKSTHSSYIPF